jgi:hypothetical protein
MEWKRMGFSFRTTQGRVISEPPPTGEIPAINAAADRECPPLVQELHSSGRQEEIDPAHVAAQVDEGQSMKA